MKRDSQDGENAGKQKENVGTQLGKYDIESVKTNAMWAAVCVSQA